MQNKLLTVSIASYNTESFIEETVRSLIVNDEYMKKIEIIIVNDGSKDRTSILAHQLANTYPDSIIVIDKENGGYGSTINASLAIASGKYYKLLDGDDWFDTKELVSFLDYLEVSDADIVVSSYYEVRESETLVAAHQEIPTDTQRIENLTLINKGFGMHEITVKTEVIRLYDRPIAEHCFYTDNEFAFYCLIAGETIARYERPIYRYRLGVDGQSVSLDGRRKHHKDSAFVLKRIIQAFNTSKDSIGASKKEILEFCIQSVYYYTFFSFMLLEDLKISKTELTAFDRDIRNNHYDAYMLGYRSKLIMVTRILHFNCYGLLCKIVRSKF